MTTFDPLSLDPDSIVGEARQRAGLERFGDEAFQEPMRRMLHAYETEGDLNDNGRGAQRERTIGLLVNRLRLEDWLARHPEIHDRKAEGPVPTGSRHRPRLEFPRRRRAVSLLSLEPAAASGYEANETQGQQ